MTPLPIILHIEKSFKFIGIPRYCTTEVQLGLKGLSDSIIIM